MPSASPTEPPARALGLIPARGASKGILRKNLRLLGRRPLIAYTIEAAKGSKRLTDVVVSTEDEEIARVAAEAGAEVLARPAALAGDDTPMIDVVQHALAALEPRRGRFQYVALLQPTSPLRTSEDIDEALRLLMETGADSVVSVYQVADHHPARMYRLREERLIPYEPEPPARLRQALPPVYHRNGAIYACRRQLIEASGTLIGEDLRPHIMPRSRSVNIDEEHDLLVAESLMQSKVSA